MSQLDLQLANGSRPYADGDLEGLTCEAKVLAAMCERSGLSDKAIAIEIDTDPALLSKAKGGQARLSERSLKRLMDLCGSHLYVWWWMRERGLDPHSARPIESKVEAENRRLREQLAELQREREVEIRLMKELRK